jgi:hypothetical protein
LNGDVIGLLLTLRLRAFFFNHLLLLFEEAFVNEKTL